MPDERTRIGVETAEKYANGMIGEDELENARKATAEAWTTVWEMGWHIYQSARAAHFSLDLKADVVAMAAQEVVGAKGNHVKDTLSCEADSEPVKKAMSEERLDQLDLLRDIIGNPFHPVSINLAWQTPTVLSLAQAAYDNRILPAGTLEPARLAVLADALEEAGCDNADILNHLRQPGEHVRGCWVVDLVLGKG
jgi:hypothetical protein